jgi:hypothetical protein
MVVIVVIADIENLAPKVYPAHSTHIYLGSNDAGLWFAELCKHAHDSTLIGVMDDGVGLR